MKKKNKDLKNVTNEEGKEGKKEEKVNEKEPKPKKPKKKMKKGVKAFIITSVTVLGIAIITTVGTYSALKFAKFETEDDVEGSKIEDHVINDTPITEQVNEDTQKDNSNESKTQQITKVNHGDWYYETKTPVQTEEKTQHDEGEEVEVNPWGSVDTDSDDIELGK